MKRPLAATFAALAIAPAAHATDLGMTDDSRPGAYGRIHIGRYPQPGVILPRSVIVAPPQVVVQPICTWAPYGHRRNRARRGHRENACADPVRLVRHDGSDRHLRRGDDRRGRDDDRGRGKGKKRD